MQDLPHNYQVTVTGEPEDNLTLSAENLPAIKVAPPAQFGGPGDQWSPEELMMAAVANCFVLSFRAISKASKVNWLSIRCESEGKLEKVDRKILFTQVVTRVNLSIPKGQDVAAAERSLKKAEETCFITNSMTADAELVCEINEA